MKTRKRTYWDQPSFHLSVPVRVGCHTCAESYATVYTDWCDIEVSHQDWSLVRPSGWSIECGLEGSGFRLCSVVNYAGRESDNIGFCCTTCVKTRDDLVILEEDEK